MLVLTGLLRVEVPSAFAQMNTGDITGTVSDPASEIIEGAEVDAVNAETQQKFSTTTNQLGRYLIAKLAQVIYTVTATMQACTHGTQPNTQPTLHEHPH